MQIEDLGYNSFFEEQKIRLWPKDALVARVTSEFKGAYKVKNLQGEYLAKVTGKHMFEAESREDFPAVGDWVVVAIPDAEHAVIEGVLPRESIIKRTSGDKNRSDRKNDVQVIATNIDIAFVVESVNRDYNLNRFERYFALAKNGGVTPAIIINKIDLIAPEILEEKVSELKKRFPDTDVILTSTVNQSGLDALRAYIAPGKTYCFLGSSGVGKSSLINVLIGESLIKTGDISSYSDRGKHVTTHRQMYFLSQGGIVIDNPGMREVGVTDVSEGLVDLFEDILVYADGCKFADCTHAHEPGCAIISAVKSGKINRERYMNYLNLKKESEFYELNEIEKREKERQFGKFIQTTKKDLKKFKSKYS